MGLNNMKKESYKSEKSDIPRRKRAVRKVTNSKLVQKVFLRNPKRFAEECSQSFISPANGKIVGIIDTSNDKIELPKGVFGHVNLLTKDIAKNCYVICIMMTVKDIHIQRVPLDGTVVNKTYRKGSFRNVVRKADDLRWIENEKLETTIRSDKYGFDYKVVQVAGLLAKRISSYVEPGMAIKRGDDLGHITLGSQVTLVIPKKEGMEINVRKGQKVIDGETILAYMKDK